MTATRRGPAPAGRPSPSAHQNAADATEDTSPDGAAAVVGIGPVDAIATPLEAGRLRPSVVRLTGNLEALAADLLEALGPAAVVALGLALLGLAGEVTR